MLMFFMLLALLALAWGLADHQLSAPIERPEPPPIVKKADPATTPPAEVPAPVESSTASSETNPPSAPAESAAQPAPEPERR